MTGGSNYGVPGRKICDVAGRREPRTFTKARRVPAYFLLISSPHYALFVCQCRPVLIWIKAAIVCPLRFLQCTISVKDISNGYAPADNTIYCFSERSQMEFIFYATPDRLILPVLIPIRDSSVQVVTHSENNDNEWRAEDLANKDFFLNPLSRLNLTLLLVKGLNWSHCSLASLISN